VLVIEIPCVTKAR